MEILKNVLKSVQGTTDELNQSPTGADTVARLVYKLQLSRLLEDGRENNAVIEHHHHYHESLDVEKLENLSSLNLHLIETTVDDLNEDCLLEIFSYLSYDDMINVKRVRKKWFQVSQQWFKQILTLEYSENSLEGGRLAVHEKYHKRKIYDKRTRVVGFNDHISFLHSCGHYIKYFKVQYFFRPENQNEEREKFIFQRIPELCQNIVNVDIFITHEYNTSSDFSTMATHWKKLETINIRYFPTSHDENLLKLFRNNKKLKTLELQFRKYSECLVNDKFCSCLPSTIREIIMRNLSINDNKQLNHFISASKKFSSLQSLEISCSDYLTGAVVVAIADIKSLTRLSLTYYARPYETPEIFNSIANMKGLKSLELSGNGDLLENSFIKILKSCLQLEQIDIRSGRWLTNKGMAAIAKLKKLKCLIINAEHVSTAYIINLCGNLEVLGCFYSRIKNKDAIKLLKNATNLRFMRFVCCRNLTKDILKAANKIVNERKNNILSINALKCGFHAKRIYTPYFTYFEDFMDIPWNIFTKDIKNYIYGEFTYT